MVNWQQQMRKGNCYFDSMDWVKAEYCYHKTISLLEALWKEDPESIEAMQAWVCAKHNLATTFEMQSELSQAAESLLSAHIEIINRMNNDRYSNVAQSLALRMSSITYRSILEFKKKYENQQQPHLLTHLASVKHPLSSLH